MLWPKHGSIVFEIDYNRDDPKVNEDGIYYILASLANPQLSLGNLVKEYLDHKKGMEKAEQQLNKLADFNMDA